jgi:hypothetical protein
MRQLGLLTEDGRVTLRFVYLSLVLGCGVFWTALINVLLMLLR